MLVIKHGKIVTMTGECIPDGDILIEGGLIREVYADSTYETSGSDMVINADGNFVFPGFVNAHTHTGLDGTISGEVYRTDTFIFPRTEAYRYVNAQSQDFDDCIKNGVTSVVVAPFDNHIVGGRCCLVKTAPDMNDKLNIVSDFCAEKMSLCSMSKNDGQPSPMRVPYFLRDELSCARDYLTKKDMTLESPALESYRPVLCDNKPVYISVNDEEQFKIAKQIINAYSLKGVIVICDDFGCAGNITGDIPIIVDPMNIRTGDRRLLASAINDKEISFAVSASGQDDILPISAGIFVRDGLDMTEAFKGITSYPAALCNAQNRIGKIDKGMDADIVIYDGNPLEVLSTALCTIIDGRVVYTAK